MSIPNQDINIGRTGMLYEEDPLAIVSTPSNNNELVAQQAEQETINTVSALTNEQRATMNQNISDINQYGSVQNVSGQYGTTGASEADLQRANQYIQWNNARTDISDEEKQNINDSILYTQVTQEGERQGNELVADVFKGLLFAGVSGTLGGALSGVVGASGSAIGTGVVNTMTNAALQQAAYGDVDTGQALLAGVNAGIDKYAELTKAATALANATGATADVVKAAEAMQATNEVLQTSMDAYDAITAVKDKDYIKGFNSALSLMGSPTLQDMTKDKILNYTDNPFVVNNIDVITSVGLGAAEGIAKGGDAGEILQNSVNTVLDDVIFTEENIRNKLLSFDNPLINSQIDSFTRAIDTATRKALDGDNSKEIFLSTTRDALLNLDIDTSDTGVSKVLSDIWASTLQTRRMIESTIGYTMNWATDEIAQPVLDLGEAVLAPAYDTFRALEEGGERAVQSLGDGVESIDTPSLSLDPPSLSLDPPSASLVNSSGGFGAYDDSELIKLKTQYGDQFVFEDLRNNPLLKGKFIA